jgi:pimeloyl-ACP methyl ester carboxylesterase
MKTRFFGLLLMFLIGRPATADALVLVHGFLGSDRSWLESGVIEILANNGYPLAGVYAPSPQGVVFSPVGSNASKLPNPVYTVDLPSTAPIALQADWLAAYLRDIHRRRPDESITLVGHSAGGVVARMTLVLYKPAAVQRLITFASPHLGTWRANQALDAVSSGGVLGGFKRWEVKRRIGGWLYYTLKASRGVLHDLMPARPGNLLYWLNMQPHPDIEYISIIRNGILYMPGDRMVPGFSQDMRLVPAIGDRSLAYTMFQGHMLSPMDGQVIVNLLKRAETPQQGNSGGATEQAAQ